MAIVVTTNTRKIITKKIKIRGPLKSGFLIRWNSVRKVLTGVLYYDIIYFFFEPKFYTEMQLLQLIFVR